MCVFACVCMCVYVHVAMCVCRPAARGLVNPPRLMPESRGWFSNGRWRLNESRFVALHGEAGFLVT